MGNSKVVVRTASSCKISHRSISLEAITHFFCKLLKLPLLIMFLTFINKMEVCSLNSEQLCSPKKTERQVLNGKYNCNKPCCFILIQGYHVTSNIVTFSFWHRVGNGPFPLSFDTKFSNILTGGGAGQGGRHENALGNSKTLFTCFNTGLTFFSFTRCCRPAACSALLLMDKMFKHVKKMKGSFAFLIN